LPPEDVVNCLRNKLLPGGDISSDFAA
jgi:hypothetical protein